MSYLFRGIIIPNGNLSEQIGLEYIVKKITKPITANIIYVSKTVEKVSYKDILKNFSLSSEGLNFLYLEYSSWAGEIEHVKAVLSLDSAEPVELQDENQEAIDLYLIMMNRIGINNKDALNFVPFSREYFERESIFEM